MRLTVVSYRYRNYRNAILFVHAFTLMPAAMLHGGIVQWDLDGNLAVSTGPGETLVAEAVAPAFAPEVIFEDDVISEDVAQVASYSRGTMFRATHGLPANGGGQFLNQYTLILDVFFEEGTTGWQALLQTSENNENDGDWFVQPNSAGSGIGISGNYGGVVEDGRWYRLALVVDLVQGTYTSYIDGAEVQQNAGLDLDGRFALGADMLIFADENEENVAGLVGSIQLRDEALDEGEIALLGGPMAAGIPTQPPPPPMPVALWTFDDAGDLASASLGADLVLSGAQAAVPGLVPADGATRIGVASHYLATHGIAPSGGGAFVNRYSLVLDFRVASLGTWRSFFQTNASNSNDAECFIRPDGAIGMGQTGYTSSSVAVGVWQRVVVVVDNAAGVYDIYIDGSRWLVGTPQAIDGPYSLEAGVLLLADENGDDGEIDVSLAAIYDRALSPSEARRLGGPGLPDESNRPPEFILATGPTQGDAGEEYEFAFTADDVDGDAVQFLVDWNDGEISGWSSYGSAAEPSAASHIFDGTGIFDIRVKVRDEHGASTGFASAHSIQMTGDVPVEFITFPYLQNVKPDGITIMWELDALVNASVEYGADATYGMEVNASVEDSRFSTFIYKAVITDLTDNSIYHFRVLGGLTVGIDREFRTTPVEAVDFSFGVWSDSQGHNHGAYPPDPLEPTKSMMAHMAERVDFGLTAGDLAENGALYTDTRDFYLDRVAKFLGQRRPWFNAWGNHDAGRGSVLRRFADMPSQERVGFDAGYGSFSFDYAGCHFVCIDYQTDVADINNWLESDLQSQAARDAKFTFLTVHVPPYCELWIDGSSSYRSTLVPLMEKYGVDVCFSGHTHEYERGLRNGIFYCITGGGSWLDFPESLVFDWPHMTVGGYQDLPGGYDKGLVNEYVHVEIEGDSFTCTMYAFDFDGTPVGILDGFYNCGDATGEFRDLDDDGFPDEPPPGSLCTPCPSRLVCIPGPAQTVEVSWRRPDDIEVDSWEIWRDGLKVAQLSGSVSSFVDTPKIPDAARVSLNYELRALGGAAGELCAALECRVELSTGDSRLYETFDSYADDTELEFGGWFVVDENNPIENSAWTVTNPSGRQNPPGSDGRPTEGGFIISDSDFGGTGTDGNTPGSGMSHDLWSPVFSVEGLDEIWLHVDVSAQLNNNGEAIFEIDVSDDAGVNWTTVFRRVAPSRSQSPLPTTRNTDGYFGRLHIDISDVAGGSAGCRLRFRHFEPSWDWWVALDNIIVDNVSGPTTGGVNLLEEDFESGIPGTWMLSGLNSDLNTWNISDPCDRRVPDDASFPYLEGRGLHRLRSAFAIIDSDCDPDPAEDEFLITPVLDCREFIEVFLHWKSEVVPSGAREEVLLSLDGGMTFELTPVFSYSAGGLLDTGEEPMYAERVLEIPLAAGQRKVAFAFHYAGGGNEWWWAIDDVAVTANREDIGGGGMQRPSDCNQDGFVDISDGICLLGYLLGGNPAELPCDSGSHRDPANILMFSPNGDAQVDISDAIYLLNYLFLGGPAPVLGSDCIRIEGCPELCR